MRLMIQYLYAMHIVYNYVYVLDVLTYLHIE